MNPEHLKQASFASVKVSVHVSTIRKSKGYPEEGFDVQITVEKNTKSSLPKGL